MYWFSQLTVHSDYVGGLLGPMLVTSTGLGMLFVPLSLVALNRVRGEDSGVASSLLNTGQQVGGAIGLAALGTVTWTTVSDSVKHQVARAVAAAGKAGVPYRRPRAAPRYLARSCTRPWPSVSPAGSWSPPGIAVLALLVVAATIRLRREDLAGAAAPTAPQDGGHGVEISDIELEGALN